MNKLFHIQTFGCQMNVSDSELVESLLIKEGYQPTTKINEASLLFINTCSIREHAEDKVHSQLGRFNLLKRNNPGIIIGVLGCMAQSLKHDILENKSYVDIVLGPDSYRKLPELLKRHELDNKSLVDTKLSKFEVYDNLFPNRKNGVNAWVTIMRGCDKFCSFCIVPFTRGRERSRSIDGIVNEVKSAVKNGFSEVTLLGQNVNSYGRDLKIDNRRTPYFAKLLTQLNEIDGLERIRFTSPHPKDFKEETILAVKNLDKVCNQIHAPLQSGSSKLLAKMHRGYNKERYIQKIDMIKSILPDVSLTTDIIVGFPGETDEDFNDTMDIVNYSEFDSIYMFQFSPRPGTAAYNMESEFINKDIISERFQYLKDVQTDISSRKLKRFVGTTQSILIEKESKKNDAIFTGKIDSGQITHINKTGLSVGDLVNVNIVDSTPFFLKAELI